MKFTITFKTPDAISEAIDTFLEERPWCHSYCPEHCDNPDEVSREMRSVAEEYVKYGEYLTVEFDTEAKTATVIRQKG